MKNLVSHASTTMQHESTSEPGAGEHAPEDERLCAATLQRRALKLLENANDMLRKLQHYESEAQVLDERADELFSLAECIDALAEQEAMDRAAMQLAAENSRRAQELQRLEEDTFLRNAINFYEMLQGTSYINRVTDEDGFCIYRVSRLSTNQPNEMISYWNEGRFVIRPENHAEYNVSIPAVLFAQPGLERRMPLHAQTRRVYPAIGGLPGDLDFGPLISRMKRGKVRRDPINEAEKNRIAMHLDRLENELQQYDPLTHVNLKERTTPKRGRAGAGY